MQTQYDSPEKIASAINDGDRAAESALIERYYRVVFYVLKKRLLDDENARDLCQETFRITIERLRKEALAEPDKLAAFLHSIAGNLCIAEDRKLSRRQTYADSDYVALFADEGSDQVAQLDRKRAAAAVRILLTELDNERDQRILHLYYIDELEKKDICEELALSDRHFDKVISRARRRFRELIATSGREYLMDSAQRAAQ